MAARISVHHIGCKRKSVLIDIGIWALATGRGWLVQAVDAALTREGLRHA